MGTIFCPHCGKENPDGEDRCLVCGGSLSAQAGSGPVHVRPVLWAWAGIAFAAMAGLLGVTTFVSGVKDRFFTVRVADRLHVIENLTKGQLDEIRQAMTDSTVGDMVELSRGRVAARIDGRPVILETRPVLVAKGGMVSVLYLFGLFALIGLAAGAAARRRINKEVGIAGAMALVVQWIFWIIAADWKATLVFTSWVWVEGGSTLMKMLPGIFLVMVSLVSILAAVTFASLGTTLTELIRGLAVCDDCSKPYSIKPSRPAVCPACGTPLKAGRIRWSWAAPAVAATLLVFGLSVYALGPRLKFYWSCNFTSPSESCKNAIETYNEARRSDGKSSGFNVWSKHDRKSNKVEGVILHQWKYIGYMTLLFFFAPLIVAWRCRKQALPTAGVTLVLNWVGAALVALTALGFGQFEAVVMVALRMHVIAGVPWCIAGLVGALIGQKLGSSGLPDDLEDETA